MVKFRIQEKRKTIKPEKCGLHIVSTLHFLIIVNVQLSFRLRSRAIVDALTNVSRVLEEYFITYLSLNALFFS